MQIAGHNRHRQIWGKLALLLACSVSWLGFGVSLGVSGNWALPPFLWRLGLSAVLVGLAIWDWRAGVLPNRGTLSVVGLGVVSLAVHIFRRTLPLTALLWVASGWAVCLLVWWLRVVRGGDAKLIMGLLALFPEERFVWLLLGVLLAGAVAAIVLNDGWPGLRRLWALFYTVFVGRTLPTRDEIEASYQRPGGSHRLGYLLCLAGLVFLWFA